MDGSAFFSTVIPGEKLCPPPFPWKALNLGGGEIFRLSSTNDDDDDGKK